MPVVCVQGCSSRRSASELVREVFDSVPSRCALAGVGLGKDGFGFIEDVGQQFIFFGEAQ